MLKKNSHSSTDPKYTLAIASELSGTAVHSIRQYVDKGLIIPHVKDNNRHRFSDVDILRLKCIKKLIGEMGLNFAGIKAVYSIVPCWLLKPCSIAERKNCESYTTFRNPCWLSSNKSLACKNSECRQCPVYRLPEKCEDVKSLIRDLNEHGYFEQ